MAKLKFKRREAHFSSMNVRAENHGDKHVPASDISVSFSGKKSDIDNLILCDTAKATDVLYGSDGQLHLPVINPLRVHRKPDSLIILIYDAGKKAPLKFQGSSAKDFEIELHPKFNCKISMKLQVNPTNGQLDRLANLLKENCELEIEATQEDLFGQEDEGEEAEDEGADEAQQELPGTEEEEEEEEDLDEEDDEDEDEDDEDD